MLPDIFITYSVIISWLACLFFSFRFLFIFLKDEINQDRKVYVYFALFAAFMLYGIFSSTVRGGYDNNHDFGLLALNLSAFPDKEAAPVFLKILADRISGFDIRAVLYLNAVLSFLSFLFFYAFLRKSGLKKIYSFFASSIIFLNFHSFLNARSLSTTYSVIFVMSMALCSFAYSANKKNISQADLFWIFSSVFLTVLSRCEQLPALFIFSLALLLCCILRKDPVLKNKISIFICFAGFSLSVLFLFYELHHKVLNYYFYKNFFVNFSMQFISENFALLFFKDLSSAFPSMDSFSAWAVFLLVFICLGAFGSNKRENKALYAALLLSFAYFCFIYLWHDEFPLHFIRHRMYMMVPFAALCGFSMQASEEILAKKIIFIKKYFPSVIFTFCFLYAALNINASHKLNSFLRTNDKEWNLIIDFWPEIQGKCAVLTDRKSEKKYFFKYYTERNSGKNCYFYYFSADLLVFQKKYEKWETPAGFLPVMTEVFRHSFYTTSPDENKNKAIVVPGFYKRQENTETVKQILRHGLAGNINEALISAETLRHKSEFDFHAVKFLLHSQVHDDDAARQEMDWLLDYDFFDYSEHVLGKVKNSIHGDAHLLEKALSRYIDSSGPVLEQIIEFCYKN